MRETPNNIKRIIWKDQNKEHYAPKHETAEIKQYRFGSVQTKELEQEGEGERSKAFSLSMRHY
jgi:hypothetical protein